LHVEPFFIFALVFFTEKLMRSVYLLVGVFAVWCLLAAFWYLFWIKGLDPKPENINPHESALAIAEILIIVIVSLFIGFGIAWFLRQQNIERALVDNTELKILLAAKNQEALHAVEQAQKAEQTLNRARETFRSDFLTISRENERLKTVEETFKSEQELLQQQIAILQNTVTDLQKGFNDANQEGLLYKREKEKLQVELSELRLVKSSAKSRTANTEQTTPSGVREIDDLKVINGIGPGIETKLNKAGIFSFRQISELTEESIEQLSSVIEFFPGRISRDRWVEQASKLYLDKLRK
jgi:predicted flap endonuclease-1-like 5' DNA nuclease